MKLIRILPLFLMALIVFSGCRTIRETQTEYINIYRIDTIRESKLQRDSIYVFEKEYTYQNGDTVFIDRWHYKYKDKLNSDTVHWIRTLTITKKLYFTKTKEVNVLKWWQKAFMWTGGIFLLFTLVFGAWRLARLRRN